MSAGLDAISSLPHYWTHLEPVWDALPGSVRGIRLDADKPVRSNDNVIVAAWQDLMRAKKAGYRRIAYLEHGIGQSYGNRHHAYPGGRYRDAVSLFLSPNETAAGMDRAAYPKARVAVVGDPHIDTLPRRVPDGQTTVAISFHWGSDIAPELRSTMPYYRAALPELARAFHVIGHAHPRMVRQAERLYAKLGIEFVPDFEDVCRRADLYIADNTSTLYEFASTGRPVVLLDAPWYRRELGLRFGSAGGVGLHVPSPEALASTVAIALTDQWAVDREAALNIVYQPRTNGAAYAVTAILDWLAETQKVAA